MYNLGVEVYFTGALFLAIGAAVLLSKYLNRIGQKRNLSRLEYVLPIVAFFGVIVAAILIEPLFD